jgi:hypothetical protein
MAEYIDSSINTKSEFIRDWLDKNLLSNNKSFHVQSGYFTFEAIEPFTQVLKSIIKNGGTVKFVLGSNAGSLVYNDAKAVLDIISGSPNSSLTIVAFKNAEFHPKCYHVKRSDNSEGALVGSGNLTQFGVSLNVEAAVLLDTRSGDNPTLVQEIKDAIDTWGTRGENDGSYQIKTQRDIEDLRQSKIIDLGNVEVRIPRGRIFRQKKPKIVLKKSLTGHWTFLKGTSRAHRVATLVTVPKPNLIVLMAELPKGSGRWKQANFDKDNFQGFFGLTIGNKVQHISLQHVAADGSLGLVESRPGVSVKSHNYRLELAAASGLQYPSRAPIGVFIRTTTDTFRYRLLMPTDPEFAIVSGFMASHWAGLPGRKRRVLTDTHTLRRNWPNSPLWIQAGNLF